MMLWKFEELRKRYRKHTGEMLTYKMITAATGLSPSTLSLISNDQVTRADLGTISSLLAFFSARLGEPLTTNDLLEWRPD